MKLGNWLYAGYITEYTAAKSKTPLLCAEHVATGRYFAFSLSLGRWKWPVYARLYVYSWHPHFTLRIFRFSLDTNVNAGVWWYRGSRGIHLHLWRIWLQYGC